MKYILNICLVFALFTMSLQVAMAADTTTDTAQTNGVQIIQVKGIVRDISTALKESPEGGEITSGGLVEGLYQEQTLEVELLSGDHKGEFVHVLNNVYNNPMDVNAEEGDTLFLYAQARNGVIENYSIRDFWHSDGLIFWAVIFMALVIIIGGKAGLKAVASLGGSVILIFLVLLPAIKNGYSPVPVTVGVAALIILVTHLIITGVKRKSWVAMLGTLGGVIASVGFVYIISYFANLSGLGTEDSRILAINSPDYNFMGIFFSGIIIGALGAVMDVAISISSGLSEVIEHHPNISRKELIRSGMNIGKDIMGSMMNTLVFAYIGSAMMSIILFYVLKTSMLELLNYGFIAEEIARSLVGSLGLLATIPLTALLAGFLMTKKKKA